MRMPIIFALVTCTQHASKSIGNSDGSAVIPDNSHHKLKKTKTYGLEVSTADQAG